MNQGARSPLRYLAPVALIAALAVFVVVIAGSQDGDGEPTASQPAGQVAAGDRGARGGERTQAETYEVQDGDTLDAIAEETGVSVDQILELNPDLDPQSLIAGQELRLSE